MNRYRHKKRSQAYQEFFAYSIGGANGTYIEIGAYKPATKSNTYGLEVHEKWQGFSIEFNNKLKLHWDECQERNNPIFFADALEFNYADQVAAQGLPKRINFLSCDIEPPCNTFAALKRVIDQGVEFDCITFEHDNYVKKKRDELDYDQVAREYLVGKGYRVAVSNVWCNQPEYEFETWFVKNDVDYPSMTFVEWKAWMGL